MSTFQPSLLGTCFNVGGENGMITDESEFGVLLEIGSVCGWMPKPEFYERVGRDLFGQLYISCQATFALKLYSNPEDIP